MSEGESIWKDSSNPRVKFASDEDFLQSSEITQNCKDSYTAYCNTTEGDKLERNKKGYYITKWTYDDKDKKFTYNATYSDDFRWGVMRVPLKESAAEQKARLDKMDEKLDKIISMLDKMKA